MNIQDFISSLPWQTIIFCFLGLGLIIFSFFASSTNKELKESGITVDGIIFSLGHDSGRMNADNYSTKDRITVRFLTTDNVWITEQLKANFLIAFTGQYKEGEPVKVTYDPQNPANFTISQKQSETIGRFIVALTGLIFIIVGAFKYMNR